jgi:hypothetical protein
MYAVGLRVTLLGAIAVAILSVSACGSGGGKGTDEVVAQISGVASISKSVLDHWIPVEGTVLYNESPTKPIPKGVIPDPPEYSACIAYSRTHAAQPTESIPPNQTVAQLKSKCANRYQELKVLALNTLIGWYWTIGAGQELGMQVSEAEAKARLKEVTPNGFPSEAAFKKFLRLTGQTVSDMVFRSKVQVFENKLLAKVKEAESEVPTSLGTQERQAALTRLANALPPNSKWAAKTTCSGGLVVSACKQYKGPEAPGLPN